MDAGIQKLKGFLAFGRGREQERRPEPHSVNDILQGIRQQAPDQAAVALTERCLPKITSTSNLHMRFKLLESLEPEVERCLAMIETSVSEAHLPFDEDTGQLALHGDNLIKAMASAYANLCAAITKQKMDSLLGHLLQSAARRAMHFLLRRQMLAYRAYATPSPSSWQTMHDIYVTTRSMRLAQGGGERQTVEQCYLIALLLGFADTNKFRRKEILPLRALVEQLLPFVVIIEASSIEESSHPSPSRFFVRTDEGVPGKPLARIPAGTPRAGNFVVECASVIAALDRVLNPVPGVELSLHFDASESTLLALRTALGGQATRRFQRQRFRPKADLVFSLPQLIAFLDGRALSRRQGDTVIEIPHVAVSEWGIVDESPDGFRVRYRKGEQHEFSVGDIVGLRQKDQSRIHVCALRRVASSGPGRLEIGLQEFGCKAQVVALTATHHRGVFLPKLPAYSGRPGLLTMPDTLPDNLVLHVRGESSTLRYRVDSCAERSAVMELHLLESLD